MYVQGGEMLLECVGFLCEVDQRRVRKARYGVVRVVIHVPHAEIPS